MSDSAKNVAGREEHLDKWWEMWRPRPAMKREISRISRYVVCSGVKKRPIFSFVHYSVLADHATFAFVLEDDYSFGVMQSDAHWQWFIAKCSKLTERFRYTPESVFDTFPWPQGATCVGPAKKQILAVAEAGHEIRRIRAEALPSSKGGLRALYRTLELPGRHALKDAHAALDAAVLDAYGFEPPPPHGKGDVLKQLLDLNLAAKRIERGEEVVAPGVPPSWGGGDLESLVTDDCIRPA